MQSILSVSRIRRTNSVIAHPPARTGGGNKAFGGAFSSEFCSAHLVTAGLDPAVDADMRFQQATGKSIKLRIRMDCQIKSGKDEAKNKKGGGTPKGAWAHDPHHGCGAAQRDRSLFGVPPRTCGSEPTPQLNSRRTSWDVATA